MNEIEQTVATLKEGDFIFTTMVDYQSAMFPDGQGDHAKHSFGRLWQSDEGHLCLGPSIIRFQDGHYPPLLTFIRVVEAAP